MKTKTDSKFQTHTTSPQMPAFLKHFHLDKKPKLPINLEWGACSFKGKVLNYK